MALFRRRQTKPDAQKPLLEQCLSVDLEVNPKTAEIFDLAAVRFGQETAVIPPKGKLSQSLDRLEKELRHVPISSGTMSCGTI